MRLLNSGFRSACIALGCMLLFVGSCQKEELEDPSSPASPPAYISVGDQSYVYKTGLWHTLFSSLSNYTLFAPSDSAFAVLQVKGNNNLVNAKITRSDLPARNGVAHRIDQVLKP